MKKFKTCVSLLLVAAMAFGLTACSGGSKPAETQAAPAAPAATQAAPAAGGAPAATQAAAPAAPAAEGKDTLVVALQADPPTLDPHQSSTSASVNNLNPVYETLVRYGDDHQIEPLLATEWKQLDDLNWEFKLRDDVYFHNGEKMTAEDVLYSFKRACSPAGAKVSYIMSAIDADNCKVIDDYTIQIATHEPFSPLVGYLPYIGAVVVSKKEFEANEEYAMANPCGTGPFKFVSWTKNDRCVYERNDNYWGPKPAYKNLIIRTIVEANSRVIELEAGTVDIIFDVPANDVARLEANPDTEMARAASTQFEYLGMNTKKAPFDNLKFRQAIFYAIDKEAIVQSVYRGVAHYTPGTVTPNMKYFDDSDVDPKYDPELAKQLLAESGVDLNQTFTIYTAENTNRVNMCTILQSMLGEVGLKIEVQPMESGAFWALMETGEQDMFIGSWGAVGFPEPDNNIYGPFHSKQIPVNNMTFIDDPALDEMLDLQRKTPDGAEREKIVKDVQKYIRANVPLVTITNIEQVLAVRSNVKGFVPTPAASHFFHKVYFE